LRAGSITKNRMQAMTRYTRPRSSQNRFNPNGTASATAAQPAPRVSLLFLVGWLAFFWAALSLLVGWPPHFPSMPSAWPNWSTIEVWLNSPILPTEWMIPLVGGVAWVLWGWTCVFVVLRTALTVLDSATRGALWVRSLHNPSNWLMIPAVRRAVDASLAGLLVARVATIPVAAVAESVTQSADVVIGDVQSGASAGTTTIKLADRLDESKAVSASVLDSQQSQD